MGLFAENQARLKRSLWMRLSERRALLVLFLCLVVGSGLVAWRTKGRIAASRSIAAMRAQASAASLEWQLSQLTSAAEILAAVAKQGRPGFTNFHRTATDLLAAHPGLAYVQLEPSGIVSDVVPRAGHERSPGVNVLSDPSQSVGANDTLTRRVLTVTGPVSLDHGEQGIVARVPIFQRSSDGRESFWGFVAVFMRFHAVLERTRLSDLARQGYQYALFASPPGKHRVMVISSPGLKSLQGTVQQPVRVLNLELGLALRPAGGWIDKAKVILESVVALLIAVIVSFSENLLESRRAVETDLTEAHQRLAREALERGQAQEDCRATKDRISSIQAELKETQVALQQAKSNTEQIQSRLDASEATKDEVVQVHQSELKQAHASLQTAEKIRAELQSRLAEAVQGEKNATLMAKESAQQNQAKIAELQARLEAAEKSSGELAKKSAVRIEQLEQSNRELKARVHVAEQAEARVAELTGLLGKAQEQLKLHQRLSTERARPFPSEPPASTVPLEHRGPDPNESPKSKTILSASTRQPEPLPPPKAAESPAKATPPVRSPLTRPSKPVKPKKAALDHQLPLFGNEGAAASPAPRRTPEANVVQSEPRKESSPVADPSSGKPQPVAERQTSDAKVELQPGASSSARRLPPAPPVDPVQLRKAVNQILPLLTDRDPGAADCLRDNRRAFRSAFAPEAYEEFAQLVKNNEFDHALEHLKRAARRHGISA